MDFSFAEFGIIAIVALLVIGPDKLPGLARTAGLWVGKVKNFISSVKTEIDAEINLQDIKNAVSSGKDDLHEIKEIFHESISNTRNEFKNSVNSIKETNAPVEATPEYQVRAIPDNIDEDDEQHNDVEDDFIDDYQSDFEIKEIADTDTIDESDLIATEGSFESSEVADTTSTEPQSQTSDEQTDKVASNKSLPNSKETM